MSMSAVIIGAVIILFIILGIVATEIGYISFTNAFKNEFAETTYRMGDTAVYIVNGDHLDDYLAGEYSEEYEQTKAKLNVYCEKINVTMMYLIVVDTSDYGRFVSVFNPINKSGDSAGYTEWELGHKRDTTNDEYRQKYKAIYEGGSAYETVFRTSTTDGQKPHVTTLVPVKDSSGNVVGIMCVHRMMSEIEHVRQIYMFNIGVAVLGMEIIAVVFYAVFIKRAFDRPIKKVSNEAMRFAKENTKGEPLGDISRFKEVANLALAIDTMETDMTNYIENLTAVTAEKEKIGAELSVAKTIQENSVPHKFPAFPERTEFDIHASMTTAKEVGGDLYNYFLIDDDHLGFVIGDVSGKGVAAALFMMVTNILTSDRTKMGGTPAEILKYVNDRICEHNEADMFVTLFLGILEISTGNIIAANAGHDDAVICKSNGTVELVKTKHGLAIGAMPDVTYKDFEIRLENGDKLFLYTDGVPEATNENGDMFTMKKTIDALNEYKNGSPQEVIDGVKSKVDEFVGGASQFDDLTMLCIKLNDKSAQKSLSVDATKENLEKVKDFVNEFLDENGCGKKTKMQIMLAVDELFTNVATYAYIGSGNVGKAEISIANVDGEIVIVLKDNGVEYDPLKKPDPDITLNASEREIGGLGVFIVKKNMDSVVYERIDGMNVLTMKKRI